MKMTKWSQKKVLIIGAARQGLALARYLCSQGALVTLNDKRTAEELDAATQPVKDFPIQWQLGHHNLELLTGQELVCVSGGVPLTLPLVQEARERGIPLSNDTQIFLDEVPCKVIGVTGSAGKTTTTTLLGRMAEAAAQPPQRAWVGGNIGKPLIDVVEEIHPDDLAVLEFSSFQLELVTRSPQVSAILNITPNHLDRHGTMENYTAIKANLFRYQNKEDWTILGSDDPGAWALRSQVPGRLASFGISYVRDFPGAYVRGSAISLYDGNRELDLLPVSAVELKGQHNLLNTLAACATAQAAGLPVEAIRAGVIGFKGVPHRLEWVRNYKGANWYNDSKATTPEGAMAAIRSFEEPIIVLLGGRDKHLPWDRLAEVVRQKVDHVIAFGEAAEIVLNAIGQPVPGEHPFTIDHAKTLLEAVQRADQIVTPGDIVLLAPGGTSYDEFNNFEERGERFKEWVSKLS